VRVRELCSGSMGTRPNGRRDLGMRRLETQTASTAPQQHPSADPRRRSNAARVWRSTYYFTAPDEPLLARRANVRSEQTSGLVKVPALAIICTARRSTSVIDGVVSLYLELAAWRPAHQSWREAFMAITISWPRDRSLPPRSAVIASDPSVTARMRCVASGCVLCVVTSGAAYAQTSSAAGTSLPAHVAVVGTDYAFLMLPTTLAPGPTLFSFENRGAKRHEMSMVLLRPDVAVESVVGAGDHPALSARAVSDSIVGLLIARPGERSGGQLFVNLVADRTYVVVCTLRDTPDSHPHADLGMVGSFRVR
jgi:hypothetical protein